MVVIMLPRQDLGPGTLVKIVTDMVRIVSAEGDGFVSAWGLMVAWFVVLGINTSSRGETFGRGVAVATRSSESKRRIVDLANIDNMVVLQDLAVD